MIRIFSSLAVLTTLGLLASGVSGLYSMSVDGVHHPEKSIFLVHFHVGLFTAVGTLLAHCLIFTYFLATARWATEVKTPYNLPDEPRPKLTSELNPRACPP